MLRMQQHARRCLSRPRSAAARLSTQAGDASEPDAEAFSRLLVDVIKRSGPMSVATFMNAVLLHPQYGYYMGRDVFGASGDFTTSPEISQVFGECVAVWVVATWQRLGCPERVQLVELGPGRGTLAADVLRTLHKLGSFRSAVASVAMVEPSPVLRQMQRQAVERASPGIPATWYNHLSQVPQSDDVPQILIAHELFDALPIHQLQYTPGGWRERVIDVSQDPSDPYPLRFALADKETRAVALLAHVDVPEEPSLGDVAEVSPVSWSLAQAMAERVASTGGAALIIDYGRETGCGDSLRFIQQHQFRHPFHQLGRCDVSADVDFAALRRCLGDPPFSETVSVYGAVPQRDFLSQLGAVERVQHLAEANAPRWTDEEAQSFAGGVARLLDPRSMGNVYKAMMLAPASVEAELRDAPPAGFSLGR